MEQIKKIEEQISQTLNVIKNIEDKNFNIYFFTLDTKGNPTAGIANIYEHVKVLTGLGYKAHILHEKSDYKLVGDELGQGIKEWLGEEYSDLSHVSIDKQNLNISPADIIVIPEIFSNIMDQVKEFPCKKVVFSQSYSYLLELLEIGKRWNVDYGFNDVITTSEKQADYVKSLFPSIRTQVVPVSIPSYFKKSEKPKLPVVIISARNQGDATKIVKSFYLQYPIYKFITFKEIQGMPREDFAEQLGKACLGVWVDDNAGFGTFPLEATECETPVIGKVPNMVPEWMEEENKKGELVFKDNGVWTNTFNNIPELIATYLKVWFEDNVPSSLIKSINKNKGIYTSEKQIKAITEVYNKLTSDSIETLKNNISKLEEIKKENTK